MHMIVSAILLAAATVCGALAAIAQTYPSRVITIVVPLPPGGATDTLTRTLADPEVATLDTVRGRSDPVADIEQRLAIEVSDGGIATVVLTGFAPDDLKLILDKLDLIKSKPVGSVAEREKMPFEVTPFMPYLTRFGAEGTTKPIAASAAADGKPGDTRAKP